MFSAHGLQFRIFCNWLVPSFPLASLSYAHLMVHIIMHDLWKPIEHPPFLIILGHDETGFAHKDPDFPIILSVENAFGSKYTCLGSFDFSVRVILELRRSDKVKTGIRLI